MSEPQEWAGRVTEARRSASVVQVLTPELVSDIHMHGGSFLGTSRGGFDAGLIADAIQYRGLNHIYIIGGDGAHRGAQVLYDELVTRRRLKVAVVCIPKTIDNVRFHWVHTRPLPAIQPNRGFQSGKQGCWEAFCATSTGRSPHVFP
jgi:hypothetical protein